MGLGDDIPLQGSSNLQSLAGGKTDNIGKGEEVSLKTDILMLRILVDYMAPGLIGPFQVIKVEPTVRQKFLGTKETVFQIVGPDFENQLHLEFFEPQIAKDICHALNRANGLEDLAHWSNKLED